MTNLKPIISVDLDEVYVKRPCSCTNISGELSELSTKFEHCCSNMSIELSNIWKAIDDLSGKISDISSQISGDDEPALPPTIFAYSASDQEITAKIAEAGAWNTEPFAGYISSADTELMMKLSSVMQFNFPNVVEIENYNHSWDSETIRVGETNYCSYSEIPFEGILVPNFEFIADYQLPNGSTEPIYKIELNQSLIDTKTISINPPISTIDASFNEQFIEISEISSYIDPENLNNYGRMYMFGDNGNYMVFVPLIRNFTEIYGHPVFKDGKKYFGINYRRSAHTQPTVKDFKPNANAEFLSADIYSADFVGPFLYEDEYRYELQLYVRGRETPVPPVIYNN